MHTGMLWFDNSSTALSAKIQKGVDYYVKKYGRQPDLVDVPVSLAATRIGVLLTELPGGAGVRVSLRSRCAVGVHTLAARHGGGGHPRAAGMTLPGSLADAERLVLGEVRRDLDAWSRNHGERGLPPQDA